MEVEAEEPSIEVESEVQESSIGAEAQLEGSGWNGSFFVRVTLDADISAYAASERNVIADLAAGLAVEPTRVSAP